MNVHHNSPVLEETVKAGSSWLSRIAATVDAPTASVPGVGQVDGGPVSVGEVLNMLEVGGRFTSAPLADVVGGARYCTASASSLCWCWRVTIH